MGTLEGHSASHWQLPGAPVALAFLLFGHPAVLPDRQAFQGSPHVAPTAERQPLGHTRIVRAVVAGSAEAILAMYVLGISCFFHDAAAALIKDGMLVAAAEEERFTRKKHDFEFPLHAIRYVLEAEGITADALDYVAFFEKPFVKFERILMTSL